MNTQLKPLQSVMNYSPYMDTETQEVYVKINGKLHKTDMLGEVEPKDVLEWVEYSFGEI